MKHSLTAIIFLFTVMFSSTSHAKWTEIITFDEENTFYVDFERIRKNDGYFFFWRLRNYAKPDEWGDRSSKEYIQLDCVAFRFKRLTIAFHTQPMGYGTPSTLVEKPEIGWKYPSPNSVNEIILNSVCNR